MSPLPPALVIHNEPLMEVVLAHSRFTLPGPAAAALSPNEADIDAKSDEVKSDNDARAGVDKTLIVLLSSYPNTKTLRASPSWGRDADAMIFASLPRTAFVTLTALSLSGPTERRNGFTDALLFEIVSLTPALKALDIGRIDHVLGEVLHKPACSLESLSTADFEHYDPLLSRSHDTLVKVCVTFGCNRDLGHALSQCTRVRHLTLVKNYFDVADILAVCPRVVSLSLSNAPSEAEMAVLQGPLRILEISHNSVVFPGSAELYVDKQWPRLRAMIYSSPTLANIRLRLYRRHLQHATEAWQEMLRVCRERRIVFQSLVFFGDS